MTAFVLLVGYLTIFLGGPCLLFAILAWWVFDARNRLQP